MDDVYEILDAAAERVRAEQRAVRAERDAFCEFRDSIPQTVTSAAGAATAGIEPVEIRDLYRETVMATADYELAYGDHLEGSIEAEFPATVADSLLSDATMPPRIKRKLLVAANESLEQRNRFEEVLGDELTANRMVHDELSEMLSDVRSLPVCSLEETSFDAFREAWIASERFLERCEQLVSDRQQHLAAVNDPLVAIGDPHALSSYLYGDLETTYPALHAITKTRRYIEDYRAGNETPTENNTDRSDSTSPTSCPPP